MKRACNVSVQGPGMQASRAASEQRGDNFKRFKDFWLKAKAIIWPWLSCMCHIRSTGASNDASGFHMQTLLIYKLGFNQNYCTFTSILLIEIVLWSKFPLTKSMNCQYFGMNDYLRVHASVSTQPLRGRLWRWLSYVCHIRSTPLKLISPHVFNQCVS